MRTRPLALVLQSVAAPVELTDRTPTNTESLPWNRKYQRACADPRVSTEALRRLRKLANEELAQHPLVRL